MEAYSTLIRRPLLGMSGTPALPFSLVAKITSMRMHTCKPQHHLDGLPVGLTLKLLKQPQPGCARLSVRMSTMTVLPSLHTQSRAAAGVIWPL